MSQLGGQDIKGRILAYTKIALRKVGLFLLVLLPLSVLLVTGLQGIDFGYHWDEREHIGLAKHYVLTNELLPEWYIYPSMGSYLSLATTAPYVWPLIRDNGFDWPTIRQTLLDSVFPDPGYHLNVRKVFLAISSLALVWVYFVETEWRRHWLEALLAASILGLSWEVGYHLRFIAPDGVVMQFGVLVTLFTLLAVRRPEKARLWLGAAAITAGLAASTKYPAGLLIAPVIVAAVMVWDRKDFFRSLLPTLARLAFLFALSYLIITPGTVLDPWQFYKHVIGNIQHYATGHGQQTVGAGLPHLGLIVQYLSLVGFSHYMPIALLFFLLALVGGYVLYRESRRETLLFLTFPVLYLIYFSSQSVMFVRNQLVLFPFLAILGARGAAFVYELLKRKGLQIGWAVLLAGLLVVNAGWLEYTAGTIQDRGSDRFIREFAAYVESHENTSILVSDQIWFELSAVTGQPPANVTQTLSSDVDMVAVYYYEATDPPGYWLVNRPGSAPKTFGPLEINLDYYSYWQADDRILLMPLEQARELGVLLLEKK